MIENFFETIDTEAKAYFLGLIFADGCICESGKNRNGLRLRLGLNDLHILETFKSEIQTNNKICIIAARDKINKKTGKKSHSKEHYTLDICNKTLCGHLIRHGCTPRKSFTLKFPNTVPNHLMNHFIRGCFDGDGCVHSWSNPKNRGTSFHWKIVGTHHICDGINKIFSAELGFSQGKTVPGQSIYEYAIGGNNQCKKIHTYLYHNHSPEFCLTRKRIKFDEIWQAIDHRTFRMKPVPYAFVNTISSTSASLPLGISKE